MVEKEVWRVTYSTSYASFFVFVISIACINKVAAPWTSRIILVRYFFKLHSSGAISRFGCWRV
jgi:hypothetical protein